MYRKFREVWACSFWAILSDRCPVCLSVLPGCPVCDVGVLWPSGWMDQDETWQAGRPLPQPHYVKGDPAPPSKGTHPQFSAHVRCGQTAGWIKMPLGMEVGLDRGDFVLDGDPAQKGGTVPQFLAYVYCMWPNVWMDQDATWYGGRPPPRQHCVRWGPAPPKRDTAPNLRPMSVVANGRPSQLLLSSCYLSYTTVFYGRPME